MTEKFQVKVESLLEDAGFWKKCKLAD